MNETRIDCDSHPVDIFCPSTSIKIINANLLSNPISEVVPEGVGSGWTPGTGELTLDDLEPIKQEALARWEQVGLSEYQISTLENVELQITDLVGSTLGVTSDSLIKIDINGAGKGWFIDSTPGEDEEFYRVMEYDELLANPDSPAEGKSESISVFAGKSPSVVGSAGTLQFNPDKQTFSWTSSDSILGSLDTGGFIGTTSWTTYKGSPTRLIFQGQGNGISLSGNVVLEPSNQAVVDVIANSRRVRYLLIIDVNDAPTDIALGSNSVTENASGAVIGNITVTDPDTEAAFRNNSVTVSDNRFEVVNNNGILQLKLKDGQSLDYETEPTVAIALTATDASNSSLTYSKNFTLNVIDVDENIETPTVSAALTNDTGVSNSDRLTYDPTIIGQTTNATTLQGNLNGNGFVDISTALNEDGSITIGLNEYEILSNGMLPDGEYTLQLKALNGLGNESEEAIITFTLDLTPPEIEFILAPESDTGELGDNTTTEYQVNLQGQTDSELEVVLVETQAVITPNADGSFVFTDVEMPSIGQGRYQMVTADRAGNQGRATEILFREGVNSPPEIISTPELTYNPETVYTYQLEASDPDGDILSYLLQDSPFGAEINENGLLTFEPVTEFLLPSYEFTVQVSDGRGGVDSQTFTVEVLASPNLGTIRGTKWEDSNSDGVFNQSESGLVGVTVYLDINNNGTLDNNEPFRITAEDDPNTPDIDETGQYEFNNLEPNTYFVREVVPDGFEQTFPTSTEVGVGDGYADVILDYFNSGAGTFDEPYGVNNAGAFPVLVPVEIILGSDTLGALSLPTGSFVTVGFTDEIIIDSPGDDIFIPEVGAAGERAEVFVSSDLESFTFLGIGNGGVTSRFDLASIGFTEPVRAIKIVGLDNGGASPGFDVINVQGLPGSVASPDYYTVELAEGELVENINFGNALIDTSGNQPPEFTSTPILEGLVDSEYNYQPIAIDPDNDELTFSVVESPEGMLIEAETGLLLWTPTREQIGDVTVTIQVTDTGGLSDTQSFIIAVEDRITNNNPFFISEPLTDFAVGVPNVATGDVNPELLSLSLTDGETITESVSITLPTGGESTGGQADIVFVVDESGSMDTEHEWLTNMVLELDQALQAQGITDNRYALIGYTDSSRIFNLGSQAEVSIYAPDNQLVASGTFAEVFEENPEVGINLVDGTYTVVISQIGENVPIEYDFTATLSDIEPITLDERNLYSYYSK
jgi:hypothetical protein